MNTNILRNIAYKAIVNDITSILYSPANSSFDLIMGNIEDILLSNKDCDHYSYYDMYIGSDPLDHIQNTQSKVHNLQILDLLWFHSPPPSNLKIEDLALIKNQLNKLTVKIFPSANIAAKWGYSDSVTIIPYGLPENTLDINKTEKVVLLNLSNDKGIDQLHTYLKQIVPDIHIINNIKNFQSINELYAILNKYKVCIDIYNSFNILAAINCGCKCITATEQHEELIGVTRILNYQNLASVIESLLNDPMSSEDLLHNTKFLQDHYSIDIFHKNINKIISHTKNKEFFKL